MKVNSCVAVVASAFGIIAQVCLAAPTLNYQGRITAGGSNFTGTGYFKFRLINGNSQGVWSNDGSTGTNAPSSSVSLNVNNGLFNVELGAGGMTNIAAAVLHENSLWLRAWFSTNGAAFEQLSPDIAINPINLALLDTGGTLIVDDDGKGDFDNIQNAINHIAANPGNFNQTILIMPGYYELSAPLTFPTNNSINLRGLGVGGDSGDVHIENTNGTALTPGYNCRLANLMLEGVPSINDQGAPNNYNFTLDNCYITQSMSATTNGPIAVFQGNGQARAFHCKFDSDNSDSAALILSDSVEFEANHCEFSCWNGEGVVLSNYTGQCEFESCDINADDNKPSLRADGGGGWDWKFKSCEFGAVAMANVTFGATFTDCEMAWLSLEGNSGWAEFDECRISNNDGSNAVRAVNNQAGLTFRDCNIGSTSNATVYVENSSGSINVKGCDINGQSANAVEFTTSSSWSNWCYASFEECRISNYSGTNKDAIVISNNSINDGSIGIQVDRCRVNSNIRDGMRLNECEIDVTGSDIQGERNGIWCSDSEIEIDNATVEGNTNGVWATNASVEIASSAVRGESGDGINFTGLGMLSLRASEANGGEEQFGRGIYCSMTGAQALAVMFLSEASSGSGIGLECNGGNYLCVKSSLLSGINATALIRGTNSIAAFSGCTFYSYGHLFGATNTNPVVVLYGATGQTPTPRFTSCLLEPSSDATYAIDLAGGATTGNVVVVNSSLTKNISNKIGKIPPQSSDSYGNHVLP